MHREELAVLLRSQQSLVRPSQLRTYQQSFQAANNQEQKGRDYIALADFFVIDSGEPAGEARFPFPDSLKLL